MILSSFRNSAPLPCLIWSDLHIQLMDEYCLINLDWNLCIRQVWLFHFHFHDFFVAKTIYAFFFVAKRFTHFICCENDLRIFLSGNRFTRFFCRENNLRTSSGKFLRVESCHPESSDFLGLWIYYTSLKLSTAQESPLQPCRGPKSLNFPNGNFQRAKTFRTKCVNRFCNKKSA